MKAVWFLLLTGLVGCGGSVENDSSPNAGGAGSGGTGLVGGNGGASASGGTGAAGGTGGSGGTGGIEEPPFCCEIDQDCPTLGGEDLKGMACVNGACKMPPPNGQCWTDSQCDFGMCVGASVCPCGNALVDCDAEQLGWCASPPPPTGCCSIDMQCGDAVYTPCVNGVCKNTVTGHCWKDEECAPGLTCLGAVVCPCGAACGVPDQPGTCG